MSMLAEPRRKQKIGPNPRGKFYSEENGVGKNLLQKMGWKAGEGLGLRNQGMSEALKPKIQLSAKGLGYNAKSDPWIEHSEEFEQILKGLTSANKNENNLNGTTSKTSYIMHGDSEDATEIEDSKKLEKKSKSSRARIHYHKFVKGKDLSRASVSDLKSIFGKNEVESSSLKYPSQDTQVDKPKAVEKDSKNINMGSMTDYFRAKMEEKKRNLEISKGSSLPLEEVKNSELAKNDLGEDLESENNASVEVKEVELIDNSSIKKSKKRKNKHSKVNCSEENTQKSEEPDDLDNDIRDYKVLDSNLNICSSDQDLSLNKIKKVKIENSTDSEVLKIQKDDQANLDIIKKQTDKKKKKSKNDLIEEKNFSNEIEENNIVNSDSIEEQSLDLNLESKLKAEMEILFSRDRKRKIKEFAMSASSIEVIRKKFKGSNIDKISGYSFY